MATEGINPHSKVSKDQKTSELSMDQDILPEIFSKLAWMVSQKPSEFYKFIGPKSVQLELTNDCNLRCNMCERWKWLNEDPELKGNLTTTEVKDLLDQLKALGTDHILLTGGEPLLREDLNEILEYADQLGLAITIITNGTILTPKTSKILAESKATIIFSVDGSNSELYQKIRGKDLFEEVIQNIKLMVAERDSYQKGIIEMHFVIQKDNTSDILQYYDLSKSLGVDRVSFSIAHGPNVKEQGIVIVEASIERLKQNFQTIKSYNDPKPVIAIREVLQKVLENTIPIKDIASGLPTLSMFENSPVPCLSLAYWLFIDAFGDVYPCCYAYHDNLAYKKYKDKRQKFCFGNIHDQPISEIWRSAKFNEFRSKMDPVDINSYPYVCGQCGSYFFFKHVMDEIDWLKNKVEGVHDSDSMVEVLEHAQAWVDSLETIDRSGKISITNDLMKLFSKSEK